MARWSTAPSPRPRRCSPASSWSTSPTGTRPWRSPAPAPPSSMARPSSSGPAATTEPLERSFRHEHGRLVAGLVRWLGPSQLDLAEDAASEALVAAVRAWPVQGVPTDPGAWLARVARNRATDHIRRASRLARLLPDVAAAVERDEGGEPGAAA